MTNDIKFYLDQLVEKYNTTDFIELDPISIPHQFNKKEDIEIAGFLAATIAWGNRKAILKSANQLIAWMDYAPHDFLLNAQDEDFELFRPFVYRTFNGEDCIFFLKSLQQIYKYEGGLSQVFNNAYENTQNIKECIANFRFHFLKLDHQKRSEKHIANTEKGSAAKRINMYLRWMVRKDKQGIDFGLWDFIPMKELMIPLDIHSGTVARKLELLTRKQDDWKAVKELTTNLALLDPNDPVKYDFALFGAGINKEL